MIAIIGGPGKDEGKKPGFMSVMKKSGKKIKGIGGDYSSDEPEEEPSGMTSEEKMLEAARPLARAIGIPSSAVVDAITSICNLMNSNQSGEGEPAESEEESE